ncbi:hypothetical protein LTR37_007912 [Vermiconidia calcicola]|uniref:Uncharacterized protein n=1 Tax=Vermiconidia calcicola TaxID=1690605 RepID=A0ACC3NDW6_9PEZI|nr:hypothetical protein LTR37_007912 [Vermiconidia calcicola]
MSTTQTTNVATEMPQSTRTAAFSTSGPPTSMAPNGTNAEHGHITIKKLHATFGAEVSGVDFSRPLDDETLAEIRAAAAKDFAQYGVLVFRKTGLDDESHIAFGRQLGELDDITPYLGAGRANRLNHVELFDVSNIATDGGLLNPDTARGQANKGNNLFHVDSSFNPRRAGYSLLLVHELPPPGMGGHTAFADTRAAFDDLPDDLKKELLERNYIANHSMWHSRKLAAPDFFADVEPTDYAFGRHQLVQKHEVSDRMNLYIAAHVHHLDWLEEKESRRIIDTLYEHATQPKYQVEIEWRDKGDLVLWDNTCTMHKAVGGDFLRKYRRDMRRVTVHDGSSTAWGLNDKTALRQGMP